MFIGRYANLDLFCGSLLWMERGTDRSKSHIAYNKLAPENRKGPW